MEAVARSDLAGGAAGGPRRLGRPRAVSHAHARTQKLLERTDAQLRLWIPALRRLEHPHIVAVHDYGRQDPFDWYAMDCVAGFDFEQVLLRDRLDRAGQVRKRDVH